MEILPRKGKVGSFVLKFCSKFAFLADGTVSMVSFPSLCRTLRS